MEKQQKLQEIKSQIEQYNATYDDLLYALIPFPNRALYLKQVAYTDFDEDVYLCTNCDKEPACVLIDNEWHGGAGVQLCKKCIQDTKNFL